jgi:hypothetical protein
MFSNFVHSIWLVDYSVFSFIFFVDFYNKDLSEETAEMSDFIYIISALFVLFSIPGVILSGAMLNLKILIFDQNIQ